MIVKAPASLDELKNYSGVYGVVYVILPVNQRSEENNNNDLSQSKSFDEKLNVFREYESAVTPPPLRYDALTPTPKYDEVMEK